MPGLVDWIRSVLWPAPKVKPKDLVDYEQARARLDQAARKIDAIPDDEFGAMAKDMQDRRPTRKRKRR